MPIEHDVKPVTYMKTKAAELLRSVDESRRPVVITQSGEPKGVLMDFASYQELRQAALLLRLLSQGEADVRGERAMRQEQVFRGVRARLGKRRTSSWIVRFGSRGGSDEDHSRLTQGPARARQWCESVEHDRRT